MSTELLQIATAQLGIPRPLLYGKVSGKGNMLLLHQTTYDNVRYALIGLGDGELDGPDKIFVNKKPLQDGALFHFHPGSDAPLTGLAPVSAGGDQRVDSFFNVFPSQVQRLPYNRLSYLFLQIAPDPGAPSDEFDWLVQLRGLKVRTFDASGNQTGYQFSQNPAWWKVDLMLRAVVKREALLNAALSADERARFDWASIYDTAQRNDALLSGGQKRYEGGVALVQRSSLASALSQMCVMDQSYMIERAGKIFLYSDKPRASTFLLKAVHLVGEQPVRLEKTNLRGAPNRYIAKFRDANPVKIAGITSMSRVNGSTTIVLDGEHTRWQNDWIEVVGCADASFNGAWVVTRVVGWNSLEVAMAGANAVTGPGGYLGTPESRFRLRTKEWVHEAHQHAVGQRGINLTPTYKRNSIELDLGVNTAERCERLIAFAAQRDLGMNIQPYKAPFSGTLNCRLDSVDDADNILRAHVAGDIITLDPSADEECAGDYEILKMRKVLFAEANDGSQSRTIELTVKQAVAAAYSDVADDEPVIAGGRIGAFGPAVWWDPNSGAWATGGSWGQNQLVNPRFDLPAASASSDLCADWFQWSSAQLGRCARVVDGFDTAYSLEVRIAAATLSAGGSVASVIANRTKAPASAEQGWFLFAQAKVVAVAAGFTCTAYVQVGVRYSDGSASAFPAYVDLSQIGAWQTVRLPFVIPTPSGKTITGIDVAFIATVDSAAGGTMPGDMVVRFASPQLVRSADASTDEVDKKGSTPPSFSPAITYTSTTNTITPAWNADIYRSNGEAPFHINGSQLCTGLFAGTSYKTWMFYGEREKAVGAVQTGGTGAPPWMHTQADFDANQRPRTAEQYRQDHIPLSQAAITMSTTTSGTGGGSGGGDGGCLWGRSVVREKTRGVIYLSRVREGDFLLGRDGKYRRVKRRRYAKHDLWVRTRFNVGDWLLATCGHPYTLMDASCRHAAELTLESQVPCATGVTYPECNELVRRTLTKISITLDDDKQPTMWSHTFLAGMKSPVISSHNMQARTT
ncbi:MAG TPA: hypothetical protein VN622_17665 [Clostridia bacterium]|nr:hypothetical protein [Clostridia bacterium]